MKRETKSSIARFSRWMLSVMGVSIVMVPAGSAAADEESSQKSEETPVLSPEEFFEGGTESYENWIELGAGSYFPSGNTKQFQQQQRTQDDMFGGIEDFHYLRDLGKDVLFQMDGRAIFNNEDYKLSIDVEKEDLGYLKFDYEQFRTWYNGDAGYYPPTAGWYPLGDDALALDRGELSFEAGLTLDNAPNVIFKYTHRFREGDKSSTKWGIVSPSGPFGVRRYLTPGSYNIDESADIFELDLTHRIKATELGVGARYESGTMDNTFSATAYDQLDQPQTTTDREGTSYDLLNVHAFSETWIKKNLFLSSGFLFANVDNDFSGSRSSGVSPGYTDLNGGSRLQQYALNVNLMAQPWKHFSIVPSVRVEKDDWDADSSGFDVASQPFSAQSNGDALDVRERLEMRYTGVTNWVFYGRGEWTQGDGNRNENGGELTPVVNRQTEDTRFFQKYVAGVNWYPVRRVSVDAQYYFKLNDYDYDNTPAGDPAYIIMQGFQTHDANVRLTLRPSMKLTLVTRYDFQYNTIDTEPDPSAGVGTTQTSQTTSQIISQNISWTPWSRLFFQVGFNYVLSDTVSPASDYPESGLDTKNNYWTLNFSSGFALSDKTDLHAGYFFYQADNYEESSPLPDGGVAVPYGAGATEHGITCGVSHRLRENIRLNLRYGFAKYEDETSGGNLDYDSHMVYGSVQYRF